MSLKKWAHVALATTALGLTLILSGCGDQGNTRISAGRKIINVFGGSTLEFPGKTTFPAANR